MPSNEVLIAYLVENGVIASTITDPVIYYTGPLDHSDLTGLSGSGVHPASSIDVDADSMSGFLSGLTELQAIAHYIDDNASSLDLASGVSVSLISGHSHSGGSDGPNIPDSSVIDPEVKTVTVVSGKVGFTVSAAARRFYVDNAGATTLTVTFVSGLLVTIYTSGSGLSLTLPGTPLTDGDEPSASGYHQSYVWQNPGGQLCWQYLATPT